MNLVVADMANTQHLKRHTLVIGLGRTGLSCVRYLRGLDESVAVVDTRDIPPGINELKTDYPDVGVQTGGLDVSVLKGVDRVVLSPGFDPRHPVVMEADRRGIEIVGDVEIFARVVDAPVIAVTGTNGKSTVVSMVGDMAVAAGLRAGIGGNLGTPALQLLGQGNDLYVLELSSFQLEHCFSLTPQASVVLNVSPDHLDRYPGFDAYVSTKAAVYRGAKTQVVNRDDPLAAGLATGSVRQISYGLSIPEENCFGIIPDASGDWLARGEQRLMPVSGLYLSGDIYVSDALAALALGHCAGISVESMCATLKSFRGLPHRMQWVRHVAGVDWYNDSKGTNVGATVAALASLATPVVLIAGGDAKGASFEALRSVVSGKVHAAVLIGKDQERIAEAIGDRVVCVSAADMEAAVETASRLARAGDSVLLSPACASQDMFSDFAHRGEIFCDAVGRLPK